MNAMKLKELIATRHNRQLPDYSHYFDSPDLRQIPDDVRAFLVEYGASDLRPNTLTVKGYETEIESILGISADDSYDLAAQAKLYAKRLPKGHVPFASLVSGDLLTLDTSTSGLYLWIHDKYDEYQLRRLKAKLPLASKDWKAIDDLTEFKESVEEDPKAKFWVDPAFLAEIQSPQKPGKGK